MRERPVLNGRWRDAREDFFPRLCWNAFVYAYCGLQDSFGATSEALVSSWVIRKEEEGRKKVHLKSDNVLRRNEFNCIFTDSLCLTLLRIIRCFPFFSSRQSALS